MPNSTPDSRDRETARRIIDHPYYNPKYWECPSAENEALANRIADYLSTARNEIEAERPIYFSLEQMKEHNERIRDNARREGEAEAAVLREELANIAELSTARTSSGARGKDVRIANAALSSTTAGAEFLKRLQALESEHEAILSLLPDDATCKHPETGESLLDNLRDALKRLEDAERKSRAFTRIEELATGDISSIVSIYKSLSIDGMVAVEHAGGVTRSKTLLEAIEAAAKEPK